MEKCWNVARRVLSLVLCVLTLCGAVVVATPSDRVLQTQAEAVTIDKTYDIAVVYDNSGSMYKDRNKAWSQAKFAMEIFASMLDYPGGDKLTIFPMYDVEIVDDPNFDNKKNPWYMDSSYNHSSTQKIEIQSKDDINKISNMYTPYCGGTPDTQIFNAKDYLTSSGKDEKWLIVLTDGEITDIKATAAAQEEAKKTDPNKNVDAIKYNEDTLNELLLAQATNGIKVQYLLFGQGVKLESDNEEDDVLFTAHATDGDSLRIELIAICNRIFQRDELTNNEVNKFGSTYYDHEKKQMTLPFSMKSVIVFVQGKGATVQSLVGPNGEVQCTLDSGKREFSTIAHGRENGTEYTDIVWDESLAGQVVSYPACEAGTYTLNCSGVNEKAIKIFYEPNVTLDIKLFDEDGTETEFNSGKPQAGSYSVQANLVDVNDPEKTDLSQHPLIKGATIQVYVDGKEYQNGQSFTLEPTAETNIRVEATYLGKYKLTSDDMASLPWPKDGFGVTENAQFKVEATVKQPNAVFKLNDMSNWQPIEVALSIKGKPLTAEEMARVTVTATTSNGMPCYVESTGDTQTPYLVYLGKEKDGDFQPPAVGECDVTVTAAYTDVSNEVITDADKKTLQIKSIEFALSTDVQQSGSWYTLSDHDNWKPVKVTMTADGRPLTDEELAMVKLQVESSQPLTYRLEKLNGQSAINIYIGQDDKGTYTAPETGDYTLTIKATFSDSYGNKVVATGEAEFEVQKYSKWIKTLLTILPFVILLLLWLFYMTRKALPKKIGKDDQNTEVRTLSSGRLGPNFVQNPNFQRKARKLTVSTTGAVNYTEKCTVTLKLRPIDNHFTKSKYRRMQIVGIDSNCKYVTINGVEYTKVRNGVWARSDQMLEEGKTPPPIKQDTKNPTIEAVRYNDGSPEATLTVKLKNIK